MMVKCFTPEFHMKWVHTKNQINLLIKTNEIVTQENTMGSKLQTKLHIKLQIELSKNTSYQRQVMMEVGLNMKCYHQIRDVDNKVEL